MISAAQLNELTRFNNAAVAGIPGELRSLRSSLRNASPEATRDALLEVAPAIADRHGRVVAAGSAEWYEQVRRSEVGGTFMARAGALTAPEVIRQNVRYFAGALFVDQRVNVFDSLTGPLTRHVMDVSRETIRGNTTRDSRAVGWQRIAQPGACDLCRMLHNRGGVYTRKSVRFASHDSCRCMAAPSWDQDAPTVDVIAYQVSERAYSPAERRRRSERVKAWAEANLR